MSTLLTNQVNTAVAPGCAPAVPPPPPGADMDGKDVVLALRFDTSLLGVNVFANNTHWPGANVALFDDMLLEPALALACDGGAVGVGFWGAIGWTPTVSQQYYLVADGIIPANEPGHMPEGAFSISIVHDGDPPNSSWLTSDAPVSWDDVDAALAASDIRVASVVTLRTPMISPSPGRDDAREIAFETRARTNVPMAAAARPVTCSPISRNAFRHAPTPQPISRIVSPRMGCSKFRINPASSSKAFFVCGLFNHCS